MKPVRKSFKDLSGTLSRDEMAKICGGVLASTSDSYVAAPTRGSFSTAKCPLNCGSTCDGENGCKCTNSGTSNSFCEAA